jgi:hypothetical protein
VLPKEKLEAMALLKEDGSLDIERINKLPLVEFMEEIGSLTDELFNEYLSKTPKNETHIPVKINKVDYSEFEVGEDAEELLKFRK